MRTVVLDWRRRLIRFFFVAFGGAFCSKSWSGRIICHLQCAGCSWRGAVLVERLQRNINYSGRVNSLAVVSVANLSRLSQSARAKECDTGNQN